MCVLHGQRLVEFFVDYFKRIVSQGTTDSPRYQPNSHAHRDQAQNPTPTSTENHYSY